MLAGTGGGVTLWAWAASGFASATAALSAVTHAMRRMPQVISCLDALLFFIPFPPHANGECAGYVARIADASWLTMPCGQC